MRKKPQEEGAAIGLPEMQNWLQTTQDIQRLMAEGVNLDGSLTPEAILALLRLLGVTTAEIAAELGIRNQTVADVIYRRRRTQHTRDAIAKRLRMPSERVWGAR